MTKAAAVSETPRPEAKATDAGRDVWSVFGMPVDCVTLDQAAARVEAAVAARTRLSVVTPNVNWLVRALRDDAAMRQIRDADLSVADGAPVVVLARKLGAPLRERVAGSDLFDRLRRPIKARPPIRVFFFGGREGAAEKAHAALMAGGDGLTSCGWINPGFGDVDSMSDDETICRINDAAPDFVVVSLGAGKGQAWIEANQLRLEAPVIAHLGAVVDFVAGTVSRAPGWVSRAGLEWLWRIFAEPSLATRYMSDGAALLGAVSARLGPLSRAYAGRPPSPLRIEVSDQAGRRVIRIGGTACASGLDPVRAAFLDAASGAWEIELDFSALEGMDAAFLGELLLLESRLRKSQRTLKLTGLTASHETILRLNAMDHLADGGGRRAAGPG